MKNNVIDLVAAKAKRSLKDPYGEVSFNERLSRIKQAIEKINQMMADLKNPKR